MSKNTSTRNRALLWTLYAVNATGAVAWMIVATASGGLLPLSVVLAVLTGFGAGVFTGLLLSE